MKKHIIKSVSVFFCFAVVLTAFGVNFASAFDKHSGQVLMAVNTDYSTFFFEGSFSAYCPDYLPGTGRDYYDEGDYAGAESDESAANDVIGELNAASPEEYKEYLKKNGNQPQAIISADYKPGDEKIITVRSSDDLDLKSRKKITVRCLCVGEGCTVWCEVNDDGSVSITEETARETADGFDSVYKEEQSVFGPNVIDTDGDGKFALITYSFEGDSLAGYFSPIDLSNEFGFAGTVYTPTANANRMDCAYFDLNEYEGTSYSFISDLSTVVHEYQHFLYASTMLYGKNNFNYTEYGESYITEGFSRCAEQLFAGKYLFDTPQLCNDGEKHSYIEWDGTFPGYTLSGTLFSYVRTRYAALTGDKSADGAGKGVYLEYHKRSGKNTNQFGMEVFGDILYPADIYPQYKSSGERARQLIIDFWKAVLLNESEGIYGFNGEDIIYPFETEYFAGCLPGAEETLGIGMAKFYLINNGKNADAYIKTKSSNIYVEAFDNIFCTVTFDLNDGRRYSETHIRGSQFTPDTYSREGCKLLGWSLDKNAETPDYLIDDTVTAENDAVYYAVWEELNKMSEETEYRYDNRFEALFAPEETAYYTFSGKKTYSIHLREGDSERIIESSYEYYKDEDASITFSLENGKEYRVTAFATDFDVESTITVKREPVSYNLTMVFPDNNNINCSGRSQYIIYEPYFETLLSFDGQSLKYITGYAYDKNAESPDFFPGDTITLSEDTTVYAVVCPADTIEKEGTYEIARNCETEMKLLRFKPETDGTYRITYNQQNNDLSSLLYDYRGLLLDSYIDDGSCAALAGGYDYYLLVRDENVKDITIEKISDKTETLLYLWLDGENSAIAGGKAFYTVPDIEDNNYKGKSSGFFNWYDNYFQPGDLIFVSSEDYLYPKYDYEYIEPGKTYGENAIYYNKADGQKYTIMELGSGFNKITAEGGAAYYEPVEEDENIRYFNTDDGCFVYSDYVETTIIIKLDPEVTSFRLEKIEGGKKITYCGNDGPGIVPETRLYGGTGYVSAEEPQSGGLIFTGWTHEYTFRGETVTETYGPGDFIFGFDDIELHAVFEKENFFDKLLKEYDETDYSFETNLLRFLIPNIFLIADIFSFLIIPIRYIVTLFG